MPTWLDKILNSQFVMIGLAGLAFLIALWLVIVIVRMLTGGRLRMSGGRTRQARLGIVDAFDLDRQRQLIIVRRDNTEHLIMIGGPNDLVIESEIVRVEARENRRLTDKADGSGDNRIPAPTMSPDAGAFQPGAEEPLLPMALPPQVVPERAEEAVPVFEPARAAPIAPEPTRAPTFPLPPRRPAPLPERRPPPPPASVSRSDERAPEPTIVAPPPPPPPAPRPADPVFQPPAADAPPQPPVPQAEAREDAAPRPPVRTPPSFLKPLPPRPPIRPLRRATPVAPGGTGAPQAGDAAAGPAAPSAEAAPAAALPPAAPVPALAPPAAPADPAAETPPHPPAKVEDTNPLESLEEEMAKLLGRG